MNKSLIGTKILD